MKDRIGDYFPNLDRKVKQHVAQNQRGGPGVPNVVEISVHERPQVIKSKHGMSAIEGMCWAFAIICSCGLAYPAYRARKHSVDRTTTTYLGQ